MRQLTVRRRMAAPAEVVWDLLVTVEAWPHWGPSVRRVELDTARIVAGSRGTVVTVGGLRLPFEITDFEPGRRWAWRVAGVAATDHRVRPVGSGSEACFGVPLPVAPYSAVCAMALRRLDRLAQGAPPG